MNKSIFRLLAGFRRFKGRYFLENNSERSIFEKLTADGQNPKTLMIACSDSRVDPAILTDASPGDIFVVRNVANLVPPCAPVPSGFHGTSSAIEFAVVNLKVENIIVLGHRQCGGIRALMTEDPAKASTFVSRWMGIAKEAREKVLRENPASDVETCCRIAEREALKISLKNLCAFPFVREAVDKRNLTILGVFFDLEQGLLLKFDEAEQQFRQLDL